MMAEKAKTCSNIIVYGISVIVLKEANNNSNKNCLTHTVTLQYNVFNKNLTPPPPFMCVWGGSCLHAQRTARLFLTAQLYHFNVSKLKV
jgi:hypothetical protein